MAKKRDNPEQRLQMAVAGFLRVALRPPVIWSAFPAGGGGRVRGAFLKAMGLAPGWPDILVAYRDFSFTVVLGIELKSKAGRQSPEQKAIEAAFNSLKWGYAICRSLEEVAFELAQAEIPTHARVSAALPKGEG